jgi:hypothetical protein
LQGYSTGKVLLAAFTQGESTQAASAYTATVNWGDGSSDVSTEAHSPLRIVVSGQTISVYGSHVYSGTGTYNLSVTLSTTDSSARASPTATVSAPTNLTSDVRATHSGFRYNSARHVFVQTITITNTSALMGPLELVLTNLSANVQLANASGTDSNGDPYLAVSLPDNTLDVGASITITLEFTDPMFKPITYSTQVQGSGTS